MNLVQQASLGHSKALILQLFPVFLSPFLTLDNSITPLMILMQYQYDSSVRSLKKKWQNQQNISSISQLYRF